MQLIHTQTHIQTYIRGVFSITSPPIVKCLRYWKDKCSACITRVTGYWALYRLTITLYLLSEKKNERCRFSLFESNFHNEGRVPDCVQNRRCHNLWGIKYTACGILSSWNTSCRSHYQRLSARALEICFTLMLTQSSRIKDTDSRCNRWHRC